MKFSQRLTRYLVGIFIGVLLSFVLFSERSCNKWLPGERVKAMISEKPIRFEKQILCVMECQNISTDSLVNIARNGSVVYKRSEPRNDPQRYFVEGKTRNAVGIIIELRDTASVVISLSTPSNKTCDC